MQDSHVLACLMFGLGRMQNGILIQPKEPFDPSDEAQLEGYRNKIWSALSRICYGTAEPIIPQAIDRES